MRDGHVRVLPLHVANKIAAGEVVERPASAVKELVENSIDAGAKSIRISVVQGGRKLVSVQDDGCGMTREDAILSLERQATSKIADVDDIERIDTLGFRGEAIPSIASVSRFSLTTRRRDSDEGVTIKVNAGVLAEVSSAGCPPGTLVEVRDLFCNVPARRKFLRSAATEENRIKEMFTVQALANPGIGFSLSLDGREVYRLAPSEKLEDRILDLFGKEFAAELRPIEGKCGLVSAKGFMERPNLNVPTRMDQYVFVNGRPATAPSIAYAIKEAYPRRPGDARPAAVIFITLPPGEVDVNVHPTKREVRFRDNISVKAALTAAIESAFKVKEEPPPSPLPPRPPIPAEIVSKASMPAVEVKSAPVQVELPISPDSSATRPWKWFRYLAQTERGFLLLETDAGLVTVNPKAARERIAYERLLDSSASSDAPSQPLLIPETLSLSPANAARLKSAIPSLKSMGFSVEEFGRDTFKIDALPQLLGSMAPGPILSTIASDLGESGQRRAGERWREELVAKSVARSFAGASKTVTEEGAVKLVEELAAARMPYVCPRGKPTLFFISNQELNRKFALEQ